MLGVGDDAIHANSFRFQMGNMTVHASLTPECVLIGKTAYGLGHDGCTSDFQNNYDRITETY